MKVSERESCGPVLPALSGAGAVFSQASLFVTPNGGCVGAEGEEKKWIKPTHGGFLAEEITIFEGSVY